MSSDVEERLFWVGHSTGRHEVIRCTGWPKMYSEGGTIIERSRPYATLDDLLADHVLSARCRECGDQISLHWDESTRTQLAERQLCFGCNFWTDRLAEYHNENVAVFGGRFHTYAPDLVGHPSHCAGYGGAEFRIRWADGREVVTHNLWDNGAVPDHFRDRLPDNAEVLK